MEILFITPGILDEAYGGPKASIRNYEAMKRYGNVTVYTYTRKSAIKSAISLMEGYYPPLDNDDYKEIEKLHQDMKFDLVFFDASIYGRIIDIFHGIKSVVFFHNCEYDYNAVRFGTKPGIKKTLYSKSIYKNEGYLLNNASCRITFSERDSNRIKEIYGKPADLIIPLGIEDKCPNIKAYDGKGDYCLLLGAVGTANVEGYGWFAKNISPYLKCKTLIAGKGFDEYRNRWSSEKIEVKGFVDDLEALYKGAYCVCIPLLSGGGMKIKVVEALMYGKNIFGTNEAFSGFEIDSSCMNLCNEPKEFIDKINSFLNTNKGVFCKEARSLYEQSYSIECSYSLFDKMMAFLEK